MQSETASLWFSHSTGCQYLMQAGLQCPNEYKITGSYLPYPETSSQHGEGLRMTASDTMSLVVH